MAQMQSYALTPTGRKNVPGSMPTYTIEAKVYDNAGTLVADLTGANALPFPGVLVTLSDAEVAELMGIVAQWLLLLKAGLPGG